MTKKKKFFKSISFFSRVLLWGIIIVFLLYGAVSFIFPSKAIKIFMIQPYVIKSSSMKPTLYFGDIVIVKKVNKDDLKVGDIITFYTDIDIDGNKDVVTHYLAEINYEKNGSITYRTRREGTTVLDSWIIEENDIIGEYYIHIPKFGRIFLYIRSGIGSSVLIIDSIIIVIIMLLLREEKKEKLNMEDN